MAGIYDLIDPPAQAGIGPAPNAMPDAQSAPIPPMPANGLAPTWREEMTKSSGADATAMRQKAEDAAELLQQIGNLRKLIAQAPDGAFGPIAGSTAARYYNAAAGNTNLVDWHDRLASGYSQLALSKAKETLGRLSPDLLAKYADMFGGPQLTSRDAALTQLGDHAVNSYDAIANGIRNGTNTPGALAGALPPSAITEGLLRGKFDPTWFPNQAALLQQAQARGLVQ